MAEKLSAKRSELVFALVGPAGVRLEDLSKELRAALALFGYSSTVIRLSELLKRYTGYVDPADSKEATRILHMQKMGDEFRNSLKDGAALAMAAIVAIREERLEKMAGPDEPIPGHAFILHQLKNPAEVDLLRLVYGDAFYLIAGHAPSTARTTQLAERLAKKADLVGQGKQFKGDADNIITIDEKEDDDLGQNTRDTYPKADFFANLSLPGGEQSIHRFITLVFRHPFHTPSPEEFVMHQARAAALRSSDFGRQVGAAIVNISVDANSRLTNADIVALGMNEVPRGGGGFYWDADSPDHRDQALLRRDGTDRAKEIKTSALVELIEKIRAQKWLSGAAERSSSSDLAREILPALKRTQFMDIGEFMRPVHAEMAALIDAARRGVAVEGRTMYVTTFPCHNCAKHIIAAGLRKVVYLEPYPKSRAGFLHEEEISLESVSGAEENGKVVFAAFSGIAPRQYARLFSMTDRGGKPDRSLEQWESNRASLDPHGFRNAPKAYTRSEREALAVLDVAKFKWQPEKIVPGP